MIDNKTGILYIVLILFISNNLLFGQVKTEPLPPYVPAEGSVAILTVENGGLANNFRDALSPNLNPWYPVRRVRN
jgi:hypothetical protein